MKRLILILFILLFTLTGCKNQPKNENFSRMPVVVNLPSDDTVGGYRTSSATNSKLTDKIDANKVDVESKTSSKTEKTPSQNSESEKEIQYCANLKSKVFHKSDCGSVKSMKEENKFFTKDKSVLTEQGYSPCKACNP